MSVCDLAINNVRVLEGADARPRLGHVGVLHGRIASIQWDVPLAGRAVIDGAGKMLAPGFIDVHAHDDFAALLDPLLEYKVLQGVTTEVVGNCGIGAAPFPGAEDWYQKLHPEASLPAYGDYAGYLRLLDEEPPALNLVPLAGHGALRRGVAPDAPRPLTERELTSLQGALDRALEAGVFGMSAGLIYDPGVHADRRELVRLAQRLAPNAPLFAVHLRSEADDLLEAVSEAIEVADAAQIGLQLSHHKAHGRNNWGRVRDSLALVDQARARGLDVWLDQYPYAAGSTILQAVLARGGLRGGRALGQLLPEDIVIASCPGAPQFEGLDLGEVGRRLSLDPQEAAEHVVALDPGTWVVVHAMDERDVETVMVHPQTLFGSDGLPTRGGRPHPRLWGTFPRILGHYARQTGLFSIEEAVRRMTSAAARRFGIEDRGEISLGYWADLVLFDPEQIGAGATYAEPTRPPEGIEAVWVNGVCVAKGGRHTGARPGRALRRTLTTRASGEPSN